MRLLLAAAALCAYTALAQSSDDFEDYDDIEARDARDAVWQSAHGGKMPDYRGFEEMAQHQPGHPWNFGAKHHARDDEDEDGLGDADGFIDATSNFASNVARAVKGAYQHVGHKAEEAVEHAKAKAGYEHDWRQFTKGGSRNSPRDVELEDDDDVEHVEDDDEESPSLAARDVEDEYEDEEIDWDPSTRYDEDYDGPELAERDLEDDEEESEVADLAERDAEDDDEDEPAATAFDDDDEDVVDPKLQLEQEFDEGIDESEQPDLVERDAEAEAEPFNFFGFGGGRKGGQPDRDDEHDAWKKGMKHVFARDSGLDPEDEELDGAYDPISEDPNLTDAEFYGGAEADEEEDDEADLEKRAERSVS